MDEWMGMNEKQYLFVFIGSFKAQFTILVHLASQIPNPTVSGQAFTGSLLALSTHLFTSI